MKDTNTITNRELNRIFSRAVQACMVDGYEIDGARSEASWGFPHAVLVKSQRGKRDSFRVVELARESGTCLLNALKQPRYRDLTIVEFPNLAALDAQKGEVVSTRRFYKIGETYGDKCAWTESIEHANAASAKRRARYQNYYRNERSTRKLELTPITRLALTVLVRRHGDRCKCVKPKDIVGATTTRVTDQGHFRTVISVKRGERVFEVIAQCPRTGTDYSGTSPRRIAAMLKLYGSEKPMDWIVGKLTRQIW